MKNVIMVDVDSERPNQVIFNKPNDFVMPASPEEAKVIIIEDLKTLAHGLGCLIRIAEDSGYGSADEMLNETINLLRDYYPQKLDTKDDEINKEDPTPTP